MIGDIIIKENIANIFVIKDIAKYLLQNIEKIGREKVSVKPIKIEDVLKNEPNIKEIKTTVASLRIDSVVSACYGVSRENSATLINDSKVCINYKQVVSSSKQVKEGDLISVRGYGRFILESILGETRKDRIRISLKVYGK